jgi:hypothetical protein
MTTAQQLADNDGVTRAAIYMRRYRERHGDKYVRYMRDFRRQRRELVIDHYGGKCVCCGETQFEFLALDHINGGGTQHKKEIGTGALVEWVIANDFPKDIQVLCHNCNSAKGFYGVCPHQRIE